MTSRWRARAAATAASSEPMSRKERYEALYPFYQEESERYEALNKRAAAYLTVIGAFAVVTIFKLDAVAGKVLSSPLTLSLGLAAGLLSIGAAIFVAWSLQIENYRTIVDTEDLVLTSDRESYTVEDTFTILLGGLAEATSINREINDRRAGRLQIALWMALGSAAAAIATNVSIFLLL